MRARLMAEIVEVRQRINSLTTRRSCSKLEQHLMDLEKQQSQMILNRQQTKGKNQPAATKRRAAEDEVIAQQEQIRLAKKLALAGEDTEGRETWTVGK